MAAGSPRKSRGSGRPHSSTEKDRFATAAAAIIGTLRVALRLACDELDEHNREYHHQTPRAFIDRCRALVDCAAFPCSATALRRLTAGYTPPRRHG